MKRVNFDLIRAEQELAGARQCIVCLCGAVLTASTMALLYKFDSMPAWGLLATDLLLCLFLSLGLVYAWLPVLREQWHERQLCQAWHHRLRRERRQGCHADDPCALVAECRHGGGQAHPAAPSASGNTDTAVATAAVRRTWRLH